MIPKRITLCAIGYNVIVAEDAVIFSSEPGIAGCFTRLTFQRCAGCWYVSVIDSDDKAMVAHVIAAHRLLSEWFGPDHDCRRGENKP